MQRICKIPMIVYGERNLLFTTHAIYSPNPKYD